MGGKRLVAAEGVFIVNLRNPQMTPVPEAGRRGGVLISNRGNYDSTGGEDAESGAGLRFPGSSESQKTKEAR